MSKEVCNLLYDKIKQLCNEKGTNIMRVEKEAGLSNATIRKWNESCPSAENLNAVAKVLNVTVDSLLNQKGTEKNGRKKIPAFRRRRKSRNCKERQG
jgi:transcriptional regulator with XRE-family HTH domain